MGMNHAQRRGQSMVELALVLPILVIVILGIIEMGYALFVYAQVQNAAREGARAAAVRPCPNATDTQAIIDATRSRLPALVDTSTITPAISYGSVSSPTYGSPVTVTVQYQFELLDPLVTSFIPQVNVNATAARTLTTACGALSSLPPTPVPTVLTQPTSESNGNGNGNGNGNQEDPNATPEATATIEPTPEPIDVTVLASKQTNPNANGSAGNAPRPLYLRVRVYRRYTGEGVSGRSVTVIVQRQGNTAEFTLGPTDSQGYAQLCGTTTYRLKDQLTVSTEQVENPPGGENAPPVGTTVDVSGANICQ